MGKRQASLLLLVCLTSTRAAAGEPTDERAPQETPSAPPPSEAPPSEAPPSEAPPSAPPPSAPPPSAAPPGAPPPPTANAEEKPAAQMPQGWRTWVNGYFRAPMSLGISSRPGPDNPTGPADTQVSYGPNRTVDSSYYSFAYTRLQEQDWAEIFVHAGTKHVDAAVGWMGYWFQAVGFRNYDAAWAPGLAYLALDTDFKVAGLNPNITLTAGAWWPKFGYFEKYDTYTLGRFRQLGEQLKLTIPLPSDHTLVLVNGFGTGRDGSFNPGSPPFYGAITAVDLLTYLNAEYTYKSYVDASIHYNTEWTADPNLAQQTSPGDKSYEAVKLAHLTVLGAEVHLRAPYGGHLWISPSLVNVRNGWALASAGTEVLHSLGGAGVATNYLAWSGSPGDSTGSGTLLNLGFLYENTWSGIHGMAPGSIMPEVTASVFALLVDARLDLPDGSMLMTRRIKQFKYGADVSIQTLDWLAFMLRWDLVNYDMNTPGYVFAALTTRATISSHLLSRERIYFQYSRYFYGDLMVLNATWPWGSPLVAGSNVLQEGPYSGKRPDENVVKVQAEIAF
jgi:hypothetical protein